MVMIISIWKKGRVAVIKCLSDVYLKKKKKTERKEKRKIKNIYISNIPQTEFLKTLFIQIKFKNLNKIKTYKIINKITDQKLN